MRLTKVCCALENIEYFKRKKKAERYIYLNCTQDIWKHFGNKLWLQYQSKIIYILPSNSALAFQWLRVSEKIKVGTQPGFLELAEEPPTSWWGQAISDWFLLSCAPRNSCSAVGIEWFPWWTRASQNLWWPPPTTRSSSKEAVVMWRLMRMDS